MIGMSDVVDHREELEERIRTNCRDRWGGEINFYDQAALDQAYAQMIIVLMALEERDEH